MYYIISITTYNHARFPFALILLRILGIKMQCCTVDGRTNGSALLVGTAPFGEWRPAVNCPPGYLVSGFNLASGPRGGDDLGATGLMMRCKAWGANLKADTVDLVVQVTRIIQ